jgi:hypothetical protein
MLTLPERVKGANMNRRACLSVAIGLLTTIGLAATSAAESALTPTSSITTEMAWGTNSSSQMVLDGINFAFVPITGTGTPATNDNAERLCSGAGNCVFLQSLDLPTGARIEQIAIDACDVSATEEVQFALFIRVNTGTVAPITPFGGTGVAATAGCGTYVLTLPSPITVDKTNISYVADAVVQPNALAQTRFLAFRVFYRLQVSPAPGTATFSDVPTSHPFFQFIEALAASGITAGCGGGNFCPNNPVTRGEMAVFLSAALGLHFPN